LTMAMVEIDSISSDLETIKEEVESQKNDSKKIKEFNERATISMSSFDFGEIECLRDEIENWKSGLEGTNLENSSKCEALSEAFDALEEGVIDLENVQTTFDSEDNESLIDDLKIAIDEIDDACSFLDGVEFPGMYY